MWGILWRFIVFVACALVYFYLTEHRELEVEYRLLYQFLNFIIFVFGTNVIFYFTAWVYRKRKRMGIHEVDNITSGLGNIYAFIVSIAFLMFVLSLWNIDFKTLFTSLSIVAAGIAIISKDYISSVIAGFILTFSKEISIGDYVQIGDKKGKIIGLTLTKISLLTDDEDVVFLPNDKVFNGEIINYTKVEEKKVSISFEMPLYAVKSVEALEKDLIDTVSPFRNHIKPDSYDLKVFDIRKDSIVFKFQYAIDQIDRSMEAEIKRKTVRHLVRKLVTAGAKASREKEGIK
ncbi:MAG TPA: mechanosensitive ion channel [Saprospiraceae bacterium]|nr:mechanosensitive ion channel [Saprospiraceae bacterium]